MTNNATATPSLVVVAKPHGDLAPTVLAHVIPEFIGRGWTIHSEASLATAWAKAGLQAEKLNTTLPDKPTLGLVLGGDGTMLRAAREIGFSGTPLLGINLGFLGFMTAHPAEQALASIQKYFAGQLAEDKRSTLHVSIQRHDTEFVSREVLNDAVITKGTLSRILNLELRIDDHLATHMRADGLIVATPTGSTAYALSAGGPITHPALKAWIIAPICPHSLSVRPGVIPAHMAITVIVSNTEEAHLTLDGQLGCPIQSSDVIKMQDSGGHVTLLKDPETSFFALLRQKLHPNERLEL